MPSRLVRADRNSGEVDGAQDPAESGIERRGIPSISQVDKGSGRGIVLWIRSNVETGPQGGVGVRGAARRPVLILVLGLAVAGHSSPLQEQL